ncbi:MAG TPA: SseB family protein [Streptosporangiaceae bacterium]|nr:SseB family protein [Streptosporangiaceae bacterium]
MLGISGGDPSFRDDDGSARPGVTDALARFAAGDGSEHEVLTALTSSRLLVPVVPVLADDDSAGRLTDKTDKSEKGHSLVVVQPHGNGADGTDKSRLRDGLREEQPDASRAIAEPALRPAVQSEKATDIAMPTLVGLDGRRALPAFTSLESLKRWRADVRPVPATALAVWQAACAEMSAVVIDVAGPVPFAVEGSRLTALARGEPPPLPADDPDVHEVVADVLATQLDVASFGLEPADDHDLAIVLTLTAQAAARGTGTQAAQLGAEIVNAVMTRLGTRLRRGVAVYLADEPEPA